MDNLCSTFLPNGQVPQEMSFLEAQGNEIHIHKCMWDTLTCVLDLRKGVNKVTVMRTRWMFFLAICFTSSSFAYTFTITNNCPFTIWPGTLAGSGTPQLSTTGFELGSSQSVSIPTIPGWSGRIWARTGCSFNELGVGTCQTGDCGGRLECHGMGAIPPASLFEITLGTGIEKDYYDVSIVDGYNLPLVAAPQGVYGECNATGCVADINMDCPKELQVVGEDGGGEEISGGGGGGGGGGRVVACKSACNAFGLDQYCCSGEFANPSTCRPSFYSTIFKRACPRAYSYAFDDGTSTFTCKAYDYSIIFCPHDLNNHHGMNRPNDTIPAPPIYQEQQSPPIYQEQQQGHGKIADMVSSSKVLLPISSISIILIVLFLNF
ncbi:unnamed protein product [Camellia sinensis]